GDIPFKVNFLENSRLGLMDLNENCLKMAQSKLLEFNPEIYRVNLLEEITESIEPFDSISTTNMLHCIPGSMEEKSRVFDNFYYLLNKNGILFGSTLLFEQTSEKSLARRLMNHYNEKEIFNNRKDTFEGLENQISKRFSEHKLKKFGCSAIFIARK
ncbi:MAG: class I SAM-dependent methyltransferase, partial [Candidatus Pacearchaeota archaeon]|nr:class I SAM-dependent methyltransferase [Candidatus Pacearchaeota archaeon]